MKIAAAYDNGEIFQDFEKTGFFKIYDIENGEIICTEIVGTMGKKGGSELSEFLSFISVDAVICGNILSESQENAEDEGITVYSSCYGNADKAVNELIFGDMVFEMDY